ncbi:MAG: twin-arginine translocation signal domain-containing protein [Candidatus Nanohaloarchaea archaeon]
MSEKQSSAKEVERRTDGGEVTDPGLEGEMEENPAVTLYRNVRDMSRRDFLKLAGVGAAGVFGVTKGREVLEEGRPGAAAGGSGGGAAGGGGSQDSRSVREKALRFAEEKYPEHLSVVEDFVSEERLADDFIDEQLKLWMSAPDGYESWQEAIVTVENGFYMNDWTKNGVPHLEPDGDSGPAYEHPFTINPDGDAFMPRFYNASGRVHDVFSGEYLGFRPGEGDKVGKLGDRSGDGSIAAYLEGDVSPEDLTGHAVSVVWYDWMEGMTSKGPNEGDHYSGRLRRDTRELVERVFADAPIENPDGTTGIDIHWIEGESIPHEETTTPREAEKYAERHIPEEMTGPINYALVVHDLLWPDHPEGVSNSPTGLTLSLGPGDGGYWEVTTDEGAELNDDSREQINAGSLMHEVYGHGVADLPHSSANPQVDDEEKSIMDMSGPRYLGFAPSEWDRVDRGMNPKEKEYYGGIKSSVRGGG